MSTDKKSKNVRLDNDVMQTLAESRKGFESPNDCIKRLLSKNPCNSETEEQTKEKEQEPNEEKSLEK